MSQERTEEPTPRRIKQARERGQVALSRDLLGGLSILVLAMALPFAAQQAARAFSSQLALSLEAAREGEALPPSLLPWSVGAMVLKTLLPVLMAIMLAGTLASIAQTGPLWAPKAIGFDPKRLDLIASAKRLLGKDNWIELLRTLLKLLIISWVCIRFLWNQFPRALSLAGSPAQVVLHRLGESTKTLLLHGGAAISALGAVDFLYRRAKWWQDLRMTKAEAKQEYKDTEGDPHAKAERERVRQEIAQHDLAEAVRRATVV
ncbi:MAG: EscU/YscU/HrcU family type III secretion system export apparatus switch protein, partial [Deltaproteobacteria bacterium]|nr:EscU/YscU/HrcU family type III secretion system export apparatus switch protein [Deltaproteobacteria bacterium]